jgi:hypothetical protein
VDSASAGRAKINREANRPPLVLGSGAELVISIGDAVAA